MSDKNNSPLIEVKNLKMYFDISTGVFSSKPLKAVDDVSFSINKGETLGLVGESGCGKTTVGRTLLHLYKPTSGEIIYDGKPLKTKADIEEYRKKSTMVFQDPYSSLNPRMTVSDIIAEPLDIHKLYKTEEERRERVLQLMSRVGLNSEHASRYAHEFSGGQRQRIGIARALAVNPEFIVCDEPVSALDVSIQAQVVNMFGELQEELGLTYLFIAHDLLVVRHISNRIAVMYLGEIERGVKTPSLACFMKLVQCLDISADYILRDELPSGSTFICDEITQKLLDLTPQQRKTAADILDAYIKNII